MPFVGKMSASGDYHVKQIRSSQKYTVFFSPFVVFPILYKEMYMCTGMFKEDKGQRVSRDKGSSYGGQEFAQ